MPNSTYGYSIKNMHDKNYRVRKASKRKQKKQVDNDESVNVTLKNLNSELNKLSITMMA